MEHHKSTQLSSLALHSLTHIHRQRSPSITCTYSLQCQQGARKLPHAYLVAQAPRRFRRSRVHTTNREQPHTCNELGRAPPPSDAHHMRRQCHETPPKPLRPSSMLSRAPGAGRHQPLAPMPRRQKSRRVAVRVVREAQPFAGHVTPRSAPETHARLAMHTILDAKERVT